MEPAQMDPTLMAVVSSRFNAAVASMMNTIFRSSRSGVLNSAHDFSCCIISADDELVMGAESLPIHMMSGPDLISKAIKQAHPRLRRGDAFLHNSPYNGNSHAADHSMLVPVIDADGVHRFSVLAKAHQADCGNSQPTTYMASATDVYEEGALLFDAAKVQSDFADNEDLLRSCRLRIRVPDQWWGDYLALLGAARVGERRILEMGEELGWELLEEFTARWFDYGEKIMRDTIAAIEPGATEVITRHDPFPGAPDGVDVKVGIEVDPAAGRIDVDLTDNVDCLPNGLNLTESTSRTAAMVGIFNAIGAEVPPNAGSFRCIDVRLRENCVVGIPVHPHSCSTATTNLADRVANAVQRGLAELGDDIGLAECGPVIPASAGVVSGRDAAGKPFVNQIFLAVTGGAGTPWTDAWLTIFHVGCGGMLRRDAVEIAELTHPLLVEQQKLLLDSEGPGRFRGAPSAYVEYGPYGDGEMVVAYGADGTVNPAKGARGGGEGGPTRHLRRSGEELEELEPLGLVTLRGGERIVSITAGGGGYGPAVERDPELVRRDVDDRWISRERATAVYAVAFDPEGAVDPEATAALRTSQTNGTQGDE